MIAEGGLANGVLSEGGKVWNNYSQLGQVVRTGLMLRAKFLGVASLISLPILGYILYKNDAPLYWIVGIGLVISINSALVLASSIYAAALSLHQKILVLQKISVVQGLGRLAIIAAIVPKIGTAAVAIIATALPAFWALLKTRTEAGKLAQLGAAAHAGVRSRMLSIARKTMPMTIYMCIANQLNIWLISAFGDKTTLANIGALGRLGQIYGILSSFASIVLVPRFAKLQGEARAIAIKFLLCVGCFAILCAAISLPLSLSTTFVLSILGANYAGLKTGLLLQLACSSVWTIAAVTYNLGAARGLVVAPIIIIPVLLLWQFYGLIILKVGTLNGSYYYSIGIGTVQLITYVIVIYNLIKKRASN